MKRIIGIFCAVLTVFICLTGCKGKPTTVTRNIGEDINRNAEVISYDTETKLSVSPDWIMKYNPENNAVNFYDTKTETLRWSTAVDEAYYGIEIKNNLIKNGLRQLVTVAYTNFSGVDANVTNLDKNCTTTLRKIKDGIRFDFDFKKISVKLSLELVLENNILKATIPMGTLEENGDYGVTRIDVLPMLGATNSSENGYFFFPDGCGAIYEFGAFMDTQKTVSMDVYDSMIAEPTADTDTENKSNVALPVFGINRHNSGMFAHIVTGAEDSTINLASDKSAYAINRLYPSIRVRKQYSIETASGDAVYTYQRDTSVGDFSVQYSFLDENCSYSDMANIYRQYLYDNKYLKRLKSSPNLALDFLVSTDKDQMIGSKSIVSTTFDEAAEILSDIKKSGEYNTATVLYGWQKGGYNSYPNKSKIVSGAGGEAALGRLTKNNNVYLLCNYTDALSGNSGFSKQSDVVYGVGGNPLTDLEEKVYLLNPLTQLNRLEKDLKIISSVKGNIAFEKFGKTLYEDFNKNNTLSRYGFKNIVKDYLNSADKNTMVATDGFFDYMAGQTDYIFNLSDDTSNLFVWAKEVPFLQMVLHGSVPYSSSLPGNLASDLTLTKLKWIEYGYIPTFMLTGNDESLIGTNYDKLFSSGYKHWKQTIVDTANEIDAVYNDLYTKYIVDHTSENGIAVTEWCDGTRIVINYNENSVNYNGEEIAARDYKVYK